MRVESTLAAVAAPLAAVGPELDYAAIAVFLSLGIARLPQLLAPR